MSYWIAVVDDEPLSLTNARVLLRSRNMRVSCLSSGKDLLEFMEKNSPDLILLDILMPEMDGFETYRALRQYEESSGRTPIPVIFLTGEDNKETERRGLKAGASDFIHKPFDEDILIKRIYNTITNSKTIETLTEEATIDRLTGFLNKASGTEKISAMCKTQTGSLMIIDMDNFKLVNDLFGHDMGDRILVAFAGVVRHNIRNEDVISRIGGDEFMGFFSGMTKEEEVSSLVSRLNDQFDVQAEKLMGKDHGIPLGISAGCVFVPNRYDDYQILFQYADSALYKVKQSGRQGYEIYSEDSFEGEETEDMSRELSRVLKIVSERTEGKGALLLGQEAFSWNYRFIVRFLKRYSGQANRILFRVTAKESGVIYSEIVASFGNTLKGALRKSDIIFQCRPNQFFVVLPLLTERDTPAVIERIIKSWKSTGYMDRAKIEYEASPMKFENADSSVRKKEGSDESEKK
ncbi:MAG: diguanylate cyclase [Lachnospiraceae bacterium]|nr:diguanylate cyclase [Lachnospiraceae bacterium]